MSKKPSDDYVGALLREADIPNEVVIALIGNQQCNVDGLRRHCGGSQRRCATKLGVDPEALDGFPVKVKSVIAKMGIELSTIDKDQIENACATWTNTGRSLRKPPTTTSSDNSGWGLGFFPPVPPPPTVKDIPFFGSFAHSALSSLSTMVVGDGSDPRLVKAADDALSRIEPIPQLLPLATLIKKGISQFEAFKCNNVPAGLFKTQLLQLLVLLGDPYYGVITQSENKSITLEPPYFEKLEEHLSKYQRFFVRYTTEDFIQATLCGKDPAMRCDEYKRGLKQLSDDLMTDFFVDPSLALAPVPEYELAFDVKTNVEAACSGAEQFERLASDYGLTSYYDKQAFLEEMRSVKVVMDVLDRKVDRLVNNSPQMLFRHLPLRDFWLDSFGTIQIVAVEKFCTAMDSYVITLPGIDDTDGAQQAVATLKKAVLGFEARRKADPSKVDASTMLIDVRNAANLFRAAPPKADLVAAIALVASALNNNTRCIMPPCPAETTVWESMKAKNFLLSTLNNTRGWVSVVGTKGSGKTQRVLSTCHTLLSTSRNKDFVWIDFNGIGSDMEAISRVVYQLGLRQVCAKQDFLSVFRSYLSSLQDGSIVVFDSLETTVKQPLGVSVLDIFQSIMYEVCADAASRLCLVLVLTQASADSTLTPAEPADEASPDYVVNVSGTASQFMKFEVELGVPPLPLSAARKLALGLCPEAGDDLVKAGRRLSGEMCFLAAYADLATIRTIARRAKGIKDEGELYALCHETVHQYLGADLSVDEKLLAACLLRDLAPFDLALAWAMTKDAFQNDKVRWKCAWDVLLSKGWVVSQGELGFIIPPEAAIVGVVPGSISETRQWECYTNHCLREAVRMNVLARESLCALQHFDLHRRHFSMLFSAFFMPAGGGGGDSGGGEVDAEAKEETKPPPKAGFFKKKEKAENKDSAADDSKTASAMAMLSMRKNVNQDAGLIARTLCGNVELVLRSKFSLTGGVAIANSIMQLISQDPGPEDFMYVMAVVEYSMLLKRMILKNSQLAEVAKGKEKKELDRLMKESKKTMLDAAKCLQTALEVVVGVDDNHSYPDYLNILLHTLLHYPSYGLINHVYFVFCQASYVVGADDEALPDQMLEGIPVYRGGRLFVGSSQAGFGGDEWAGEAPVADVPASGGESSGGMWGGFNVLSGIGGSSVPPPAAEEGGDGEFADEPVAAGGEVVKSSGSRPQKLYPNNSRQFVFAKALALLGCFLEDLGMQKTRKADIGRSFAEAVAIWQGNNENVETNFLYAEVMVRVGRAAGDNTKAGGGKKCLIM